VTATKNRVLIAAVAAVAVIVVGVLAWLLWPSSDNGPTVLRAGDGTVAVQLTMDAPKTGAHSLTLNVTDPHGAPLSFGTATVEAVMPQMGHALTAVTAAPAGPGVFRADGLTLPMSGQWELTVTLSGGAKRDQVVFPLLVSN
jgi:hypothetical protein